MLKKSKCFLLFLSMIFLLSGCWDYRGLNEMAVVIGVAVDKDPTNNNYHLSFEVVDLSLSLKDKGPQSKIIDSEGKTIFDAVRNAKKRVNNKLYFGQTQIVVFSDEIARSEDFSRTIDWFTRDGELRNTIYVLISQEKTAREIINSKGIGMGIVSVEIQKIVDTDNKYTSSAPSVEFYQVFNTLRTEGESLILPAIHNVISNDQTGIEINGMAIFKGERLIGYLPAEETKYYLFAMDEIDGGILTFPSEGACYDDISLEISDNTTKCSFEYTNGKIKIFIHTDTSVFLGETIANIDALDDKQIAALEDIAEAKLEKCISNVILRAQTQYDSDIFGFGNMIYEQDFRLWNQLKNNWDEQFETLQVVVQSDIHIENSAALEKS